MVATERQDVSGNGSDSLLIHRYLPLNDLTLTQEAQAERNKNHDVFNAFSRHKGFITNDNKLTLPS